MQNNRPPPPPPGDNVRNGLDWLYLIVSSYSMCLVPFIRHSLGVEGVGISGVGALLVIAFFGAQPGGTVMVYFFWAWLAALFVQRLITWRRVQSGWVEHSRYSGYPYLALGLPLVKKEVTAKVFVEPFLCVFFGVLICNLDKLLGGFVILGGFAIYVKGLIDLSLVKAKVRAMRDARIEQVQLAERYRSGEW